jgi:hypothetical protein
LPSLRPTVTATHGASSTAPTQTSIQRPTLGSVESRMRRIRRPVAVVRPIARLSHGEPFPSLPAPAVEHLPAAGSGHACAEAMSPFASRVVRLVCAFHRPSSCCRDCSHCLEEKPKDNKVGHPQKPVNERGPGVTAARRKLTFRIWHATVGIGPSRRGEGLT